MEIVEKIEINLWFYSTFSHDNEWRVTVRNFSSKHNAIVKKTAKSPIKSVQKHFKEF